MPPELRRLASTSLLLTLLAVFLGIAGLAVCVSHGGAWATAGRCFLLAALTALYVPSKLRTIRANNGRFGAGDLIAVPVLLAAIYLGVQASLAGGHVLSDGIAALAGLFLAPAVALAKITWDKRSGYDTLRDAWLASQSAGGASKKP
jgi:hypothetical protein